uniref:F-box domain-containing protein n=1 Tax=Oryza glumipatula TaxID=40148 RepID=A0A0D9YLV4_9ORYZ
MVPRGAALGRGGGVDEHPRDGDPVGDGFPGEREGEEEERVVEAEVGGGELWAEEVQHIATPTATQLGAAAMNDDVVAEILLRLPAKSVLRCRAVCRSWRRITTADYFVAAHSRRRPLQLLGYTGPNDESLRDDEFLVTSAPRVNAETMLICNPATRQLVNLPPVSTGGVVVDRNDLRLHSSAFYFHRPSGEYRVLCYRKGTNYILSTGSGEARRLGPVPDQQRRTCSFSAVTVGKTVGESVYWGRREVDDRSRIMAFDTVSERFRAVAPPPVEHADEGPLLDMHGRHARRGGDAGGAVPGRVGQRRRRRREVGAAPPGGAAGGILFQGVEASGAW